MKDNYKEIDLEKERMKAAFRYIDKDNDGHLTLKELKAILCHNNSEVSDAEIEQFFKEIDTDGDGKIDYEGKTNALAQNVSLVNNGLLFFTHLQLLICIIIIWSFSEFIESDLCSAVFW